MGSLCSKSSNSEGGHAVLGSGPSEGSTVNRQPGAAPPMDRRAAAAEAAERRMQAAQNRGTLETNPKAGKLSEQLAKQQNAKPTPQAKPDEGRLVWD